MRKKTKIPSTQTKLIVVVMNEYLTQYMHPVDIWQAPPWSTKEDKNYIMATPLLSSDWAQEEKIVIIIPHKSSHMPSPQKMSSWEV